MPVPEIQRRFSSFSNVPFMISTQLPLIISPVRFAFLFSPFTPVSSHSPIRPFTRFSSFCRFWLPFCRTKSPRGMILRDWNRLKNYVRAHQEELFNAVHCSLFIRVHPCPSVAKRTFHSSHAHCISLYLQWACQLNQEVALTPLVFSLYLQRTLSTDLSLACSIVKL